MNTPDSQACLFAVETAPAAPVSGVPAGRFDPAAYDAALAGDGYAWFAALLPHPAGTRVRRVRDADAAAYLGTGAVGLSACHPAEAA